MPAIQELMIWWTRCGTRWETIWRVVKLDALPELVRTSEEIEEGEEGSHSAPGHYGFVWRHAHVTVKGLDRNGKECRIKAYGLLARVFQHEVDHLDDILFTDGLESMGKLHRIERRGERLERAPVAAVA